MPENAAISAMYQPKEAPQSAKQRNARLGSIAQPQSSTAISLMEQTFEAIRDRLDSQFPKDPYLADAYLAATLHMAPKTLANRRAAKPDRYPAPLHIGGARVAVHERSELIDWLAREELRARAKTVHRCA